MCVEGRIMYGCLTRSDYHTFFDIIRVNIIYFVLYSVITFMSMCFCIAPSPFKNGVYDKVARELDSLSP